MRRRELGTVGLALLVIAALIGTYLMARSIYRCERSGGEAVRGVLWTACIGGEVDG